MKIRVTKKPHSKRGRKVTFGDWLVLGPPYTAREIKQYFGLLYDQIKLTAPRIKEMCPGDQHLVLSWQARSVRKGDPVRPGWKL